MTNNCPIEVTYVLIELIFKKCGYCIPITMRNVRKHICLIETHIPTIRDQLQDLCVFLQMKGVYDYPEENHKQVDINIQTEEVILMCQKKLDEYRQKIRLLEHELQCCKKQNKMLKAKLILS